MLTLLLLSGCCALPWPEVHRAATAVTAPGADRVVACTWSRWGGEIPDECVDQVVVPTEGGAAQIPAFQDPFTFIFGEAPLMQTVFVGCEGDAATGAVFVPWDQQKPLEVSIDGGDHPLAAPLCAGAVSGCPATTADIPDGDPRLGGEDVIVVFKGERRLGLYSGGALRDGACWEIALARGYPAGHKQREGDKKTPEGWYTTSDKPGSKFYGAIAVHYPGAADAAAGEADGRITPGQRRAIDEALAAGLKPPQQTPLGGEILIHGGGAAADWTLGCVAMDNDDLDTLRAALPQGMAADVLILP
jgi:hypothetical protein